MAKRAKPKTKPKPKPKSPRRPPWAGRAPFTDSIVTKGLT